jgi:hypothetical protein
MKSALFCLESRPLSPILPWESVPEHPRTWESVASPAVADLNAVCYGNGTWLALSANPGIVFLSPDGIAWNRVAVPGGAPLGINSLRFINGRFVARGYAWKQSVDGLTWTKFPLPPDSEIHDLTYAQGRWVCVGSAGLFASAQEPGDWNVNKSAITCRPVTHAVYLGGRFHAFSPWTTGMQPFSSADGVTWAIQPQSKGIWFDHLEQGQIERADGSVESVVVGTSNGEHYHIGRAEGDHLVWETGKRDGVSGKLIYRRSTDAALPGLTKREWVSLQHRNPGNKGLRVFSLRASGEIPVFENQNTLNDILSIAAGPDAMIAVGTGGLIRRYPTGLSAAMPVNDLTIRPTVELKWNSRAGLDYHVEESRDMNHWQPATPVPLIGTGSCMAWTAPETPEKRYYRLRVN